MVLTVDEASLFMDSNGKRRVVVKELPVISNLIEAEQALNLSVRLSATEAIYDGLVPALILMGDYSDNILRKHAVSACDNTINDKRIVKLMQSFVSGELDFLQYSELLPCMNTAGPNKLRWIPGHLMPFLSKFAENNAISPWIQHILRNIVSLFQKFRESRTDDGLAWEYLFQITVLIRLLGGMEHVLLPVGLKDYPYVVSYNSYDIFGDVSNCKNFGELYDQIIASKLKITQDYHVAVIAPTSSQFKAYDLFVVVYKKSKDKPQIFGYQLKQGSSYAIVKDTDNLITKSFLIKGGPHKSRRKKQNPWYVAIESELSSFFGVSGIFWTPTVWRQLKSRPHRIHTSTSDNDIAI